MAAPNTLRRAALRARAMVEGRGEAPAWLEVYERCKLGMFSLGLRTFETETEFDIFFTGSELKTSRRAKHRSSLNSLRTDYIKHTCTKTQRCAGDLLLAF